jgi:hypothetical protein
MKREFVPFALAVKLKTLGFDEPCLKLWEKTILFTSLVDTSEFKKVVSERYCSAPTWQSAFRWLLKEHNLYAIIIPTITMHWTFKTMTIIEGMVEAPPYKHVNAHDYVTQEEAELACLEKLIEIVEFK